MDIPVDTPIPVGRPQGPTPLAPTYPATRRWIETWRVIAGNRKASVGLTIVGFFILLAIFGPIVLPQDPHTFTTDILQAAFLPNKGPLAIGFVLTVTGWSWGARVLRSQTLSLRTRDCVQAARASGESTWRIIFYEILPNQTSIVAAQFFGTVIYVILAETALEYLGLGDINASTWGNMLFSASNNAALLLGAWWWFLAPGLCVALLGAGLAFVNFGIDEISNPRLRRETETKPVKLKKAGKAT